MPPRSFGYWLIGGTAGGIAGALCWVLATILFGTIGGWAACAIGFLVGAGVRYAGWKANVEESKLEGLVAVGMTLLCIVVAKLVLFLGEPTSTPFLNDAGQKLVEMRLDEEGAIASVADDLVIEQQRVGYSVTWPDGSNFMTATNQDDCPPEVWADAENRWRNMSPAERNQRMAEREKFSEALSFVRPRRFLDHFTPLDWFWIALAAITAYKIGVGTYGMDD